MDTPLSLCSWNALDTVKKDSMDSLGAAMTELQNFKKVSATR